MIQTIALLLAATLFGGMVFFSLGFAPMVLRLLPPADAGRFIRAAFPWYYLFVIASSGLGGLFVFLSDAISGWLLIGIACAGVFARQVLMPSINAARDMDLQGKAGSKARFGQLHLISVVLNFAQLMVAGIVLDRFLK